MYENNRYFFKSLNQSVFSPTFLNLFLSASGDNDHEMRVLIQVEIGRALGQLPLRKLAGRKNVDDEAGVARAGMRVDVDDAGGLLEAQVLDEAGVEILGVFDHLFARSAVRYGHQQAMLGGHLHASDHSFQLLSFQTHSLIDPETSGREGSAQHGRSAGRHGRALFRRQRVARQFGVAGDKVHRDERVVVFQRQISMPSQRIARSERVHAGHVGGRRRWWMIATGSGR